MSVTDKKDYSALGPGHSPGRLGFAKGTIERSPGRSARRSLALHFRIAFPHCIPALHSRIAFPHCISVLHFRNGARGEALQKKTIPSGFEPLTAGLEIRCSIQLSYGIMQDARAFGTGSTH